MTHINAFVQDVEDAYVKAGQALNDFKASVDRLRDKQMVDEAEAKESAPEEQPAEEPKEEEVSSPVGPGADEPQDDGKPAE